MGNELQKELEKMNNEIAKHEDYLKSEKTTYGLADLINGKIPSKQLPSEVNLTANTVEDMNQLVSSGAVNDGQLCYCKEDKKLYVLKDEVWSEVGGGKSVPPTLWLIDMSTGQSRTSITEEEKTNLDNGLYNQVVYMQDENDYIGYQLPTKLIIDTDNEAYSFATFSADGTTLALTGINLFNIIIDEKDETTNTYPITISSPTHIDLPGADTRTVVLFNRPNQILAPNDGGEDIILPCTTADNGKVLSVVDGEAQWATPASGGVTVTKDSADANILPLPSDASTSTYVLKAVNGTVQWVKES